jgi:p-cumate 2,3-dioxygenase subunit beta
MTNVVHSAEITRADIEDFLFGEAAILDEWRLEEWLDLFTIDCLYEIPAPDRLTEDPGATFSLIHDRRPMLEQRVIRLTKPTAHAEYPHSRTRRLITNVRITSRADTEVHVAANFAVFRSRSGVEVTYVGRYEYTLEVSPDGLKIRHRKAILDQEVLDPHGKISIIL